MSISTFFVTVSNAFGAIKTLAAAAKTMSSAELKSSLAELANRLADAELEMAEAKQELTRLELENRDLKAKQDATSKPTMKWGCYQFDGEEGLFCPKCYEEKGKKHRTNRTDHGKAYQCTVCQTKFPTR